MEHRSRAVRLSVCVAMLVGLSCGGQAFARAPSGIPKDVKWIWSSSSTQGDEGVPASKSVSPEKMFFRTSVTLPPEMQVVSARLLITADDLADVFLNGNLVKKKTSGWAQMESISLAEQLRAGDNVLGIEVTNRGSLGGLIAWVNVVAKDGSYTLTLTDSTWKASSEASPDWMKVSFDDSSWPDAKEHGPLGMKPWGDNFLSSQLLGTELSAVREPDVPVTPEKARELLEAEWLYQANQQPTPERSLLEIGWARQLADRFSHHATRPDFKNELAQLTRLESQLQALSPDQSDDAAEELYLAVRTIKREIMQRNPLLDFDKLLLVDTPHYSHVHESAHRNGHRYRGKNGSQLMVLDGLGLEAETQVLVPPSDGYIMRMDLSFDAEKIVFAMNPKDDHSFHLYEIGVNGKGLRQLTNSDYDDMDPIYLPSGQIIFSTSRGHSYVRCLPTSESTVLARCESDGSNIRIISRNNEPDYTPTLLPDGRILYTRWEYTERPLWRLQKLWTMNPDGTEVAAYWGNGSAYPDMCWEARPIPDTKQVMFAAVGHHNVLTGSIGIVDIREGLDWPKGITKVTAEVPWPEVGNDKTTDPITSPEYHNSGPVWSYRCPHPLGPEDFLVSAARSPNGRFDLFLMDVHGNRELLYVGTNNSWYARPLRPRVKPRVIPDRVDWPIANESPKPGVLFSPNVYEGVEGLPPGSAKYLRVIQMDAKTYSTGYKSWRHSGPVISVIQEDGVKRILGDVPIEADGSVAFKVPSGQALHFQLLDEHRRCIQIMRSFTGVMPGETRGCVGCHALGSSSPQAGAPSPSVMALRKSPADLAPPPWGADVSVSYERFCQPMLDKYCGRCHQGEGKGRETLDLTLRGGEAERGITDPRLLPFKEPYLTLVGPAWNSPNFEPNTPGLGIAGCLNVEADRRDYGPLKPMTMLSSTSPLIERVMSGEHHKVKIKGDDLLRLIAWVDCNCVYRGDEEVRAIPDPEDLGKYPVPVLLRSAPCIDRLQSVTDPPVAPEKSSRGETASDGHSEPTESE